VGGDFSSAVVGGEAELEGSFLMADVGERLLEAFAAFLVVVSGVVEKVEQSLFHDAETGEGVVVGEGDFARRCVV
jgi:hypothetical protein